jgi:hypothetical protein
VAESTKLSKEQHKAAKIAATKNRAPRNPPQNSKSCCCMQ